MSNPIEEGVAEEIEQRRVATRKFLQGSGGTFEVNKDILRYHTWRQRPKKLGVKIPSEKFTT